LQVTLTFKSRYPLPKYAMLAVRKFVLTICSYNLSPYLPSHVSRLGTRWTHIGCFTLRPLYPDRRRHL
jgi:hypothetical protein